MNSPNLSEAALTALLDTVRETAVAAGRLILEKWREPRKIMEKAVGDWVTDADLEAQALITARIRERYPTHGFVTEEKDASLPTEGDLIWIIDPVDGTTNYGRQHPIFCVSIAAAQFDPQHNRYHPIVGAIYDPMQNELFSAADGRGAWLNEEKMCVSDVDTLTYTIVGVDWSYSQRLQRSTRDVLPQFGGDVQGVRCLGTAALGLAWVAAGRYDAYVNYNLRPWDMAAAELLIREAGGTTSSTTGDPFTWSKAGIDYVGSNGRIHTHLLEKLRAA